MGVASRFVGVIVDHSRLAIALVLVLTGIVAAGAMVGETGNSDIGQDETDAPEQAALEEIESSYETDDAEVAQIVVRGDDVLTRDSLLESLRLQQQLRENESINATLDDRGIVGIENVVGTAAVAEDAQNPAVNATLDQQIAALESRSPEEVEALVGGVLDGNASTGMDATAFLPTETDPTTTSADARMTLVFQNPDAEQAYDAQVGIDSVVEERFETAFVFGEGIVDDASSRAIGDSFLIITPVALLLLLAALTIAYRDVIDVVVSLTGVGVVMAWLAGVQGWLSIPSSSLLIAVPFLLIGLSLDYSLHVVMRYREARTGSLDTADTDGSPTAAMRRAISGVGLALVVAAATTAIGFFSNYASPLGSIQDFAVLSSTGILAMLLVFAVFVPALKLEAERLLDRFGRERRRPAFGDTDGPVGRGLSAIATLTHRAPIVVLITAVLLASGGGYGATGIDTEFNQADFLPEDAPEWMDSLPEPFAPDDYDVGEQFAYLSDNFRQRGEGTEAQILVRGNVTDPAVLTAIDRASSANGTGNERDTIVVGRDGAAVESPVTLLRDVSATNESVANAIETRDTDGDGLPDRDVAGVYDRLYTAAPERAETVLHRSESGTYESARLIVGVQPGASAASIAEDVRDLSGEIEHRAPVTALATGGPVVTAVVQGALFETLVEGFAITLGVILAFLIGLYWWRYRAPDLGVLVVVPVLIALAWLLGTMAALDVPFNSETVVITSLAIGLGVDYSVHLGERFIDERDRHDSVETALSAALTGTGGALLGSALTTASGFGVLALALSPPLQRFGLVTGLSIVYAFIACVTVLPSLFVVRARLRA